MIVTGTRKDAEQGGDRASVLAPSTGLSSQGGTGPAAQSRGEKRGEGRELCKLCWTNAAG